MNMQTEMVFQLDRIEIPLQLSSQVWAPTGFAQHLAQHLVHVIKPGDHVLELGLGCGVLAILAAKLGAQQVTGLDINPDAVTLAEQNWCANRLDPKHADFRQSDLLNALNAAESPQFDIIFSNPPVLPELEGIEQTQYHRDDFEISGRDGRRVLDAVLSQAGKYLKPNGQLLTIATSLQGWRETEAQLNTHWQQWEVAETVTMELTDECTPTYLDYWRQREQEDGRQRTYLEDEVHLHAVWFIRARHPRD